MKNLNNYKIENKKILFRADLNVPVVDGVITDTSRIEAIKSSIKKLTSSKNKIFFRENYVYRNIISLLLFSNRACLY